MLSNETASGKFPLECIQTMHEIICAVETKGEYYYDLSLETESLSVTETISESACLSALKLNAQSIVCLTTSGKTATQISSYRPKARIIAVTDILQTLNSLELVWGIQTFAISPYKSLEEAWSEIQVRLLSYGLLKPGEKVILTLGLPVEKKAKTNAIQVFEIDPKTPFDKNLKTPLRCKT